MPAKSRVEAKNNRRISAEAVEAFRCGAREDLHRELGLRPWQPSPLETPTAYPPAWCVGTPWEEYWRVSHDLRTRLIKAGEAGKSGTGQAKKDDV